MFNIYYIAISINLKQNCLITQLLYSNQHIVYKCSHRNTSNNSFNNMKKWGCLRQCLILISLGIFVIQSFLALMKFKESPTVIVKQETTWDSLHQKPRNCFRYMLYICTLLGSKYLVYLKPN